VEVVDSGLPVDSLAERVPLGDLAGAGVSGLTGALANPLAGNGQAIIEGKALFRLMNCAGCHGYDVAGGMGPNLTDPFWLYGGAPVNVYKSILEGRPRGMPAWGMVLSATEIWKIVAYVQSLGGTTPPAEGVPGITSSHAPGEVGL
jgi:cytochrome c oxidase cbb3-type subunit 3